MGSTIFSILVAVGVSLMVDKPRFLVRFWGVRGSYPTPGTHTLRHGGNTSCVEVQAGPHTLILDAGSGIIRLGETLMSRPSTQRNLALFFTHGPGDHLLGIPFFAPLFDPHANIHLFGPQLAGKDVEQLVTTLMSPPYFPVDVHTLPSQRTFHTIADTHWIVWDHSHDDPVIRTYPNGSHAPENPTELRVRVKFTQAHPLNCAIIHRIEYSGRCVVYATDVECRNA